MKKQTTPAIDFTDVNIQVRRLGDLKPYGKNPRINDNAVGAVGNSIESFRYKNLIVVDKDNTIIAGHTRYKAIKKMGYKADTPIKVIVADDLTEEEGKAYRIADNSTGELATWDYDLLMPEIADLDFDMSIFGLDLTDTEAVGEPLEVVEDDYVEPEHLEPVVKRGEVYRLGGHFLMCGDSSIPEDLRKLMAQGGGR